MWRDAHGGEALRVTARAMRFLLGTAPLAASSSTQAMDLRLLATRQAP